MTKVHHVRYKSPDIRIVEWSPGDEILANMFMDSEGNVYVKTGQGTFEAVQAEPVYLIEKDDCWSIVDAYDFRWKYEDSDEFHRRRYVDEAMSGLGRMTLHVVEANIPEDEYRD